MATFSFVVTVEVEDDAGGPTEYYPGLNGHDWTPYCETVEDEDGATVARFLSPRAKAEIVMGVRLGCDEELGIGDYSLDWVDFP